MRRRGPGPSQGECAAHSIECFAQGFCRVPDILAAWGGTSSGMTGTKRDDVEGHPWLPMRNR